MTNKYAGKFIVLDGPDGSGKSTQASLLSQWLRAQGVAVVSFRDPGTTKAGEAIRDILLCQKYGELTTNTELMLYMAARIELWDKKIKPSLEQGKCVVMDRWLSSSCAYQGFAGGFGIDKVLEVAKLAMRGLGELKSCEPKLFGDITIILDLPLSLSTTRLSKQLDRMELKGDDYHQKVRQGYKELIKMEENSDFGRINVVNATEKIEAVHQNIVAIVDTL